MKPDRSGTSSMSDRSLDSGCLRLVLRSGWPAAPLGPPGDDVFDIDPRGGAASDVAVQVSQWRVTQQAVLSRPNSVASRPRGPSWTLRRPTRSGQSRPRWRFPPSMRAFASPLCRVELAEGARIFFRRFKMRKFTDALRFLKQGPGPAFALSPPATFRD